MATKVFLLIFASLLFVQTAFAEQKIDKVELADSVTEFYIQRFDQIFATIFNNYESIFNEVENNATTIDREYVLKVAELKAVLERANAKTSALSVDALKRQKSDNFVQIILISIDIIEIARRTPKLSEQVVKLQQARDKIASETEKIMKGFIDQIREILEKYWNGLTPAEQQIEQKLGEVLKEVKKETDTSISKKFYIIEKAFNLIDGENEALHA